MDKLSFLGDGITLWLVQNPVYFKIPSRFHAPDYIFIVIEVFFANKLILKWTFITRANRILINIHTTRLYFACTALSITKAIIEHNKLSLWSQKLYILDIPSLRLDEHVAADQTHANLLGILSQHSFNKIRNFPADP